MKLCLVFAVHLQQDTQEVETTKVKQYTCYRGNTYGLFCPLVVLMEEL